ncbi:MAG: radical SAM protein [Desulfobacterales bacterium]|nr:radical SAM protein [Desulfobacterales bacterium]
MIFSNSFEQVDIALEVLEEGIIDFLERYAVPHLVGKGFYEIVRKGDGTTRFYRLLKATGYKNNPAGFFFELIQKLSESNFQNAEMLKIGNIAMPHLLLVSVLEKIIPGNRFLSVKDVDQVERLTNIHVPEKDRSALQEVIDRYPVRLSMHIIRQMRISRCVAYQYLPFIKELDDVGHIDTWVGQFQDGLLEQMYQNRVVFLLNMSCPVYCRFCFRKHKESRNQAHPIPEDIQKAVDYVRRTPSIKEILITGGDPFLNKINMMSAIEGLKEIPHVQTLRLATRSISYYPYLFYENDGFWLNYLKMKKSELEQNGKRVELASHFIHPDEISPQSLDIISDLVKHGISVYIQTPFLKNCNDKGPELTRLFSLLRGAGAELHNIYIPCSPIHGSSIYWTPLQKGIHTAAYLRAHLSDRVIPRICTATSIGKIDWHISGWAVERVKENERFLWIRTPYTHEYYKAFAKMEKALNTIRVNKEGTIDVQFMAEIGEDSLLLGSRPAHKIKHVTAEPESLQQLQKKSLNDQRIFHSIVSTGSTTSFRLHETRVALDTRADDQDLEYVRSNDKITDAIIFSDEDAINELYQIEKILTRLTDIHHVNAVRLRSLKFNYAPEIYSRSILNKLESLNRLTIANPLRLEIETEFLHSNEFKPIHFELFKALHNCGITVYVNTPLLGDINDSPEEISSIAYKTREIGLEFHHVYIAGHRIQSRWNKFHPIDIDNVIDIGTRVRRDGSGREIPLYIILTRLGEVDFGLTSKLYRDGEKLWVKLLPYVFDYYRSMDPNFFWPQDVTINDRGHPIIEIEGVQTSSNFMVELL